MLFYLYIYTYIFIFLYIYIYNCFIHVTYLLDYSYTCINSLNMATTHSVPT